PEADGEAVRRAFLGMTKRYHPARYARESPDTVEVATELFLLVRRAYAQLSDDNRRRGYRERVLAASRAIHVTSHVSPPPAPPAPPPARPAAQPRRAHGPRPPGLPKPGTQPPPQLHSAPPPVSPTTGRTEEQVKALLDEARTRGQRFEQATRLLARGQYA